MESSVAVVEEPSDRKHRDQNTNRNEANTSESSTNLVSASGNDHSELRKTELCLKTIGHSTEKNYCVFSASVTTAPYGEENENYDCNSDTALIRGPPKTDERKGADTVCLEDEGENGKPAETSNGVDTASDDDFEVICRYSSAPLSVSENCGAVTSLKAGECSPSSSTCSTAVGEEQETVEGNVTGDSDSCFGPKKTKPRDSQVVQHGGEYSVDSLSESPKGQTGSHGLAGACSQSPPVDTMDRTTTDLVSSSQTVATTAGQDCNRFEGPHKEDLHDVAAGSQSTRNQPAGRSDSKCKGSTYPPKCQVNGATPSSQAEGKSFIYPSIYVSTAGLISVLLRHDMSVEMTLDRTIRVVSHQHLMAVATDSRGTSACLYHPALKVIQQGTSTEISTETIRVHMGHDDIAFAIGPNRYRFDDYDIHPASQAKFSDMSKDQSVNLLYSSDGYGESLVPQCLEVASTAEYANLPKGGVIVRINGVKVTQTGSGDVTVVTGAKFIRLSPSLGMSRLGNRFIDIEIERDWCCRVSRGAYCFFAGDRHHVITNGKLQVDVNEEGRFKVAQVQPALSQCLSHGPEGLPMTGVTYTAPTTARSAPTAAIAAGAAARAVSASKRHVTPAAIPR